MKERKQRVPPEAWYPNYSFKVIAGTLVLALVFLAAPTFFFVRWCIAVNTGDPCIIYVESVERTRKSNGPRRGFRTRLEPTVSYYHNGQEHVVKMNGISYSSVQAGDVAKVWVDPVTSKIISDPFEQNIIIMSLLFSVGLVWYALGYRKKCIKAHPPGSMDYHEARALWLAEQAEQKRLNPDLEKAEKMAKWKGEISGIIVLWVTLPMFAILPLIIFGSWINGTINGEPCLAYIDRTDFVQIGDKDYTRYLKTDITYIHNGYEHHKSFEIKAFTSAHEGDTFTILVDPVTSKILYNSLDRNLGIYIAVPTLFMIIALAFHTRKVRKARPNDDMDLKGAANVELI